MGKVSAWEEFLKTYEHKEKLHRIHDVLTLDGKSKLVDFKRMIANHNGLTGYIVFEDYASSSMCFKWEFDDMMLCTSAVSDVEVKGSSITVTTRNSIYILERRG